jgi:hypothetical protein
LRTAPTRARELGRQPKARPIAESSSTRRSRITASTNPTHPPNGCAGSPAARSDEPAEPQVGGRHSHGEHDDRLHRWHASALKDPTLAGRWLPPVAWPLPPPCIARADSSSSRMDKHEYCLLPISHRVGFIRRAPSHYRMSTGDRARLRPAERFSRRSIRVDVRSADVRSALIDRRHFHPLLHDGNHLLMPKFCPLHGRRR